MQILFKNNLFYSFKKDKYLMDHKQLIHTDEKRFGCEICEKRFRSKRGLLEHMQVHTDDRSFPCTFCDKRFKRKNDLKVKNFFRHFGILFHETTIIFIYSKKKLTD